ncbi:luciferin 4-monooxygenase-like [Cydia pomonella]|uniref:luciferin 4-monooxygenase-like n=1 Tax=Cydia pomonella TaxID=82600 RepID=UPI002ADE7B65|nr:luciferin 4-monooxygenase-like [Cydia pomonella]
MYPSRRVNDSVHWFVGELTSRVVAESGTPSDIHHLGKILLQSFKDDPDFVSQIDGATGESETNGSVLERSVRCAIALKSLGLQRGDVITLMAPNHIDLAIPFYAALYLGVIVSAIDMTLVVNELQSNFEVSRPKVVFCQSDRAQDVQQALKRIESDALTVTFGKGGSCSFIDFLEKYGGQCSVEKFKPTDFDPEDTIATLVATSGTTGLPKCAAATHKNLAVTGPYLWTRYTKFPTPTKLALIASPLQWLTAQWMVLMSPVTRITRLQSSQSLTQRHTYYLINTYKPTFVMMSPTFMTTLLIPEEGSEQCDFSCFETIAMGGGKVPVELVQGVKKLTPNTEVFIGFGISEASTSVFVNDVTSDRNSTLGTVGKPMGCWQYRLIDVQTQEDISEAYKNGEIWLKGPGLVKGYYRNPEATAEAFTKDGWFKTGDMVYRDENYNFFYVERIKLLLKYMNHQISPLELEATIRQHPGVLDVAVTGIPDKRGELPVACVVRRPGHDVNAEEIKQLVKENLTDSKQLRGGVLFLDAIPQTATTKIHRRKLKEIALKMLADPEITNNSLSH